MIESPTQLNSSLLTGESASLGPFYAGQRTRSNCFRGTVEQNILNMNVAELTADGLLSVACSEPGLTTMPTREVHYPDPGLAELPNKDLGVALLRDDVTRNFQHIRVGGMVLSSLDNDPDRIVAGAIRAGVAERVSHIAASLEPW